MLALLGSLRKATATGNVATNSLRFRASNSAYLSRPAPSVATNTIWTYSCWLKRGSLSESLAFDLFTTAQSSTQWGAIYFFADNLYYRETNSTTSLQLTTTQVFRDASAWYHIVLAFDSTNATPSNRVKLFVNGNQITSFSTATYPNQNYTSYIGSTGLALGQNIGRFAGLSTEYFDGYMTEVNFVTGQALTPSSFGQINSTTGVWQPKQYTGTYGINGFLLEFADASAATAAAIGKDTSGNGNNWTPSGISVTAGVTYDSMLDVPNNYADGGNGRGNYATLNPIFAGRTANASLSAANLQVTNTVSTDNYSGSTIGVSSGKWYWENACLNVPIFVAFGICRLDASSASSTFYAYENDALKVSTPSGTSAYGVTFTSGDVIGVAFDAGAGTLEFYKNGASQGIAFTGIPASSVWTPFVYNYNANTAINFGQRPFAYTPPTGFVALNTQNLPTPAIANGASVMAATTYTGTGSALTITNTNNSVSFQPDFVWLKGRSGATNHALYDVVRGTTKDLVSNSTAAETTQATGLTAFNADGFDIGALAKLNTAAATYIAWQWKAGGTAVSNTAGTITSQVSANQTAGFSIVTWITAGSDKTIGHGLGKAPAMVIYKNRSIGAIQAWPVWHQTFSPTTTGALNLSTTAAVDHAPSYWNSAAPSSTVLSTGSSPNTKLATTGDSVVAYCFAEIAGFSRFGSYTGNGSADGPFVYCGFRPRFIMVKSSSVGGSAGYDWIIQDTTRSTSNVSDTQLIANGAQVENVDSGGFSTAGTSLFDITSNGFKLRNSSAGRNASGATYIFAAFAENPSKYALAR